MISFNFRKTNYRRYYVKLIPFHLDKQAINRIRLVGQLIGITILSALIFYTLIQNLAPLGTVAHYNSVDEKENITQIEPSNRVKTTTENGTETVEVFDDHVYFKTKMPYSFDKAKLRLTFKNPHPEQTILIGFQDRDSWHYDTIPYDVPYLNDLAWNYIGNNPRLYQKTVKYNSIDKFLLNFPNDSIVGVYGFASDFWINSYSDAQTYKSRNNNTIIDVPLRGKHVMYAYLDKEPFTMNIQKQDLNWYEDPDVMVVKIYKGSDLVFEVTAEDDGIQDNSKKVTSPQDIQIQNSGPGYPESGIYKIVIDANSDTIIKRITTNLHKIVFDGTIYPAANQTSYPNIIGTTIPTTVYTDSLTLSALTYRDTGKQEISVGNQSLPINETDFDKIIIPNQNITKVIIPENDVFIRGFLGFFAFSPEQYFRPTKNYILPISNETDLSLVDYVFTTYSPSSYNGNWQYAEREIDIRSAFIEDNQLSWIIQAPGLKEHNRSIIIKSIDVTFEKSSWFE